MQLVYDKRKIGEQVLILSCASLAACAAVVLTVLPLTTMKMKMTIEVVGAATVVAGAFLSGNPRLYSLYLLMITMPFDLSKHFGAEISKMGGESSFRAELSDPFWLIPMAFIAWEIFTRRRPGLRIPKATYIWIAIALQGMIPVILGPYRTTAAHEVFRMMKVMLLFLVVVNELETPKKILHCSVAMTVSVILESCVGIVERIRGKLLGLQVLGETSNETLALLATESVQGLKVFRPSAFLRHPNLFGVFLAALMPLAIAAFFYRKRPIERIIFLLGFVLGFPALIATMSRSGWVSFALSFSVMFVVLFFHNDLRPRLVLPATTAVFALLIMVIVFWGPITKRLFDSKSGATIAREMLSVDAWALIWEKPWMGWDMNSYAFNVPKVMRLNSRNVSKKMWGKFFPVVHNTYLLWWVETGVVGLLLNLWLWAAVIWAGIKNLKVKNELLFLINAGCLGGVTAFILDGFFSFSLRMNAILRTYWILAGVIFAIQYWRLRHPYGEEAVQQELKPEPQPEPEPVMAH